MINCASLYTYEIDDLPKAADEIKKQLDQKISLMDNTVGIVMCHVEFVYSGALKYICESLPFDLVGITTASQAVNDTAGELILTILVITSDDVTFKTGITENMKSGVEAATRIALDKTQGNTSDEPRLALIFPPLILDNAGDIYTNTWNELLPNTPNFGTIAIDDSIDFTASSTVYNGETYKTEMPFVLCYGNINPRFLVATLPETNVMPFQGEITKSDGPFVSEINNMNAYQYLNQLGFAHDVSLTESLLFVPFMLDLKKRDDYDGIPVLRGLAAFDENGTAIFRGNMDQNSVFTLSKCNEKDVSSTALAQIELVNGMDDVHGALAFSCIVRRAALVSGNLAETRLFNKEMKVPFMMGYSGGEICPTSVNNSVIANRFHNYSLIILVI